MLDMATMDIMARGLLMLNQLLPLSRLLLLSLGMDIMDTMAKDLPMLSPDMATDMVMDMDMDMAMDMVAMDTMDIMARGPLMLDMAMVVMDMVMVMVMAMDTVMDMDTMVKQ